MLYCVLLWVISDVGLLNNRTCINVIWNTSKKHLEEMTGKLAAIWE